MGAPWYGELATHGFGWFHPIKLRSGTPFHGVKPALGTRLRGGGGGGGAAL